MIRALLALALLLAAVPAGAEPVIRGLFVGIDKYLYSKKSPSDPGFSDLKGAVADAAVMKQALELALKVRFDRPGRDCRSANTVSVTLTDRCATRAAILQELTDQIRAARPGDTVLFYFAGHGSTLEDELGDQAGRYSSTLLPTDARPPSGQSNDILDREIGRAVAAANLRGVHVITLFDSCFSGTGARGEVGEGVGRGVKPVKVRDREDWFPPIPLTGPGGGYRVHFGASRDTEEAREVTRDGAANGVFTLAFTQALLARPQATFGDLATAVRLRMEQDGHRSQHPQAEGQLNAAIGGAATGAVLYDAEPDGAEVVLGAGRVLGISTGSTFALFDSQSSAQDPAGSPLAQATVAAVEDGRAKLKLDGTPQLPLPARLIARELVHAYGQERIRIALREGVPAAESRLFKILSALPFVEAVDRSSPADLYLLRRSPDEEGPVNLFARDGSGLAGLGEVSHPAFAERLRMALLPIYKARRLLALPARSSSDAQVKLCLSAELDHPLQSCPEPADKPRAVPVDTPLVLTVTNDADAARHINVLVVDDRYGITQLVPTGRGNDAALRSGGRYRPPPFKFDTTGLYRFIIFTADTPINTAVLEQSALRASYQEPCDPAVEQCSDSAVGARDGSIPVLGQWTVTIEDALIERKGK